MKELNKLHKPISEITSIKHSIKSKILSDFSKVLFGYPPGKNKPGKPPNLKKIHEILEMFNG